MKYLILLLLTFNAHAQFRVEYIESATGGAYNFERNTQEKAKERFIKILDKSQWMKGEWKETPASDLFKVETYFESLDTGETEEITDLSGNTITVPIMEQVEKTRTLYYHPINFTYTITDISQEIADKEAEKAERKQERQQLKALKQTINASDLPQWHKKLLKYLIREIRE